MSLLGYGLHAQGGRSEYLHRERSARAKGWSVESHTAVERPGAGEPSARADVDMTDVDQPDPNAALEGFVRKAIAAYGRGGARASLAAVRGDQPNKPTKPPKVNMGAMARAYWHSKQANAPTDATSHPSLSGVTEHGRVVVR